MTEKNQGTRNNPINAFWSKSAEELFQELNSQENGISENQAKLRMTKYALLLSNLIVISFVLVLPFSLLGDIFGFVRLPFQFYIYMVLIVAVYVFTADFAKRWFYKKLASGY